MKTYIVYVKGEEQKEYVKAGSMVAAEKKARKKYPQVSPEEVQVCYTEI